MLNLPFKHPLEQISAAEIDVARESVLQAHQTAIIFRNIYNIEPPKSQLIKFLEEEHAGTLSAKTQPPDRLACVQYDVISQDRNLYYMESTIHLASGKELSNRKLGNKQRHSFTVDEFQEFIDACILSPEFQQAVKKLELPKGFEEIAIDPWPFGGPDATDQDSRLTQLFCFARDKTKQNEDANHYAYPLPICVVMDTNKKTVVRVERLPTGGILDGLLPGKESLAKPTEHCNAAEYAPELLDAPIRQDYNPLNVIQPEGASFSERNGLVEWQKWRFRISFTPRECAVLHDIHYDGRSVFHRLSFSELTVPYADPRAPYHRKHAFDFGDAGAGRTANNLALGCDCLGAVRYIDAMLVSPEGKPDVSKNVVCIHEQDDGILWKHTNLITGRAVVVRNRKLIIQYIITLGNYEYIFAYHFDLAGGISVETRPTGIMSPVSIEENKFSNYGNVVGKGILAQNHQHIFAVRIDPAIDGHNNTVVTQDSIPIPMNPDTNPHGNAYEVRTTTVETSTHIDASPFTNRVIKISNPSIKNTTSGNPVAYKFTPSPSQLLLADPSSLAASRAKFATHHVWVTKHKDYEFWAGGEFTNQAEVERGGCFDAAARNDDIQNTDLVVWAVFGFTHNPRVEDWPVMPVEKHELHFTPADFFDANPALDVPSQRNSSSVLVGGEVSLNGCSYDNDSFFST
ncbi:hypothetical protein HYALB_00000640 [Hymenoscyphus albidus]|uniref:Amine oxidase n=1 Tax=Hymenoscyphus albidus TaxID=595503 RepID=A0A9N9M3D3_9HELO|nr:hypothetical protein HYALB_00000640 [Hymenoscyphus albidus]